MTNTRKLGITVAVVLAAVGCSASGKSSSVATTTTVPANVTTTTTSAEPPSTIGGTGDSSVEERVMDAATAEFTLYTDTERFTDDPTVLTSIEDSFTWAQGLTAPSDPTVVNVAVSSDAQWACLTGHSSTGRVFVVVTSAADKAYDGTSALTSCSAAAAQRLRLVN